MKDQRDDGWAYAIEDGGYRLEVSEMDIESAERGHDGKVRKDEGPSTGPGAPKTAAEIGDVDADLDRQGSGKRLADRDGLAHLLFREPLAFDDQFALHLADQRHRAAEAEKAEPEEIAYQFTDISVWNGRRCRHVVPRKLKYLKMSFSNLPEESQTNSTSAQYFGRGQFTTPRAIKIYLAPTDLTTVPAAGALLAATTTAAFSDNPSMTSARPLSRTPTFTAFRSMRSSFTVKTKVPWGSEPIAVTGTASTSWRRSSSRETWAYRPG